MIKAKALNNSQIGRAAAVMLVGFLASGLLGLVRTAVFNATFGASAELEAFITAQRIPEMLFTLVAGGALGSSFIPVFAQYLAKENHASAWRLASAVMTLSAIAASILGVLLIIFAPVVVTPLMAQDPPEYQVLAIRLTQIMLVTTVIFSASGLLMGILNAHQIFLLPALALSMNNIGLIIGALVISRLLPPDHVLFSQPDTTLSANIYGLAFGAVIGALLHLLVQVPGLPHIKAQLRPIPNWGVEGVREVLTLMLPRMFGLAVVQTNFMISAYFANGMVEGSYVALSTAWYLMFFVLGIIAQSIGTAVFPSLSALAAAGDMEGYKDRLAGALRGILFLAFPATVGLIILGQPVITILFERNEWTPQATAGTAWALAFLALGIAGHGLLEVLSRAFYALSDTMTPVLVGVAAMVANIILNMVFIQFVGDPNSLERGAFAGLALAISLTTIVESLILWVLLARRINGGRAAYVLDGALRALLAALGMGAAVWAVNSLLVNNGALVVSIVGMITGMGVFFVLAFVLGLEEARTVPVMVLRRIKR